MLRYSASDRFNNAASPPAASQTRGSKLSLLERVSVRALTTPAAQWWLRQGHTLGAALARSSGAARRSLQQGGVMAAAGAGAGAYNWQDTCLAQAGGADAAQIAPAAENNKAPILEVLRAHLPAAGAAAAGPVLEVASGTGQHIAHFAAALPHLAWQPSDLTPELFASIAAHCQGRPNVRAPLVLDASWPPERWQQALASAAAATGTSGSQPVGSGSAGSGGQPAGSRAAGSSGSGGSGGGVGAGGACRAVIVANMTHIAPWSATTGLVAGAAAVLAPGGLLSIYGPFKLAGAFTTDSNRAFHERLVTTNPEWGYRNTDDITALAAAAGLALVKIQPMPANNFMLLYAKRA